MEIVILLLGFGSVYFLTIALYNVIYKERILLSSRLEIISARQEGANLDEKLNKPFIERIIHPLWGRLAVVSAKIMPAKKKMELHRRLQLAGNPGELSPNEFLLIQYGLVLGLPLVGGFLLMATGASLNKIVLVAAGGLVIGLWLPDFYLKNKAQTIKDEIQKSLPDVLDLLTVSVEAGLGFDAALAKVIDKVKGHISEEFNRVLQEIRMGKPRREALRDMSQRSGVDDLATFVGAIIQADQLGVSIGNVLRLQSEQIRQKRRQVAEEKAMKAPIKMLIPLVLFIFPTIFIVLLGPAVLDFFVTMGN
ncbi:MAG: type II secretion system F family protein [Thermincolia bacterium]